MIKVIDISKTFKLYRSPSDRLKEIFLMRNYHTVFHAIKNIHFEVEEGESLGIIGRNGAGKSTLLKILAGVTIPDKGTVEANGKITGLLELGTGFNPEMNGLDNIRMNGALIGMTREEIKQRNQDIVQFSELGEFIQEPIKTYSSGMTMRLAFSIAIHANPKCFLVDEALSVGDAHFQQKCMRAIREFKNKGGSIIFVSHSMDAVKMLCEKAVLIEKGEIIASGTPENVANKYNHLISKINDQDQRMTIRENEESSFGNFDAKITKVNVRGENSRGSSMAAGETASVIIEIQAHSDIDDATVGILIRDKFGQDIFGTNTYHMEHSVAFKKNKRYLCVYTLPMNIGVGKYTMTVALHSGVGHEDNCYHWWDKTTEFEITARQGMFFQGVCMLEPSVLFEETP